MPKPWKKKKAAVLLTLSGLVSIGLAIYASYFRPNMMIRFNFTDSQPKGLYVLRPPHVRPLLGHFVTFCLEPTNPYSGLAKERGYIGSGPCPLGLKPLLKNLAGQPGDMVEVSQGGITVNGNFLPRTERPAADSRGREMPPSLLQSGIIPEGRALVLSPTHGRSFDSRHFGLVPLGTLIKVEPLVLFPTGD